MKQAHIFVSGMVQGVGYRQFVKSQAKKLGLNGWVRNLPDGRVEAIVQGEKKDIEELVSFCNQGPFLADVKQVVVEWETITETFSGFDILHA